MLAKFAAQGQPFQLALPFEEATLIADSVGAVVHVSDTTKLDWAVLGQRVAVVNVDEVTKLIVVAVPAIVQAVGSNTITLDVSPGNVGRTGGRIMPTVPVLLNPQQGFAKYPNPEPMVEAWAIDARRVSPFGFQQNGTNAFAALASATGGRFHDATAVSALAGAAGNGLSIQFTPDGPSPGAVTTSGGTVTFHYSPGVTTSAQAVLALRPWFNFLGPVVPGTLGSPIDSFGPVALAGGVDQIYGYMGRGATVTVFDGRPVWDRGVQLSGATASDSIHAMTETIDIGAVFEDIGPANTSDWGRQVSLVSADPDEFQWLKAFLGTVQGRRRAFWMPTQVEDLVPVSLAPGVLVVSSTEGDMFTWYPRLRDHVQVWLPDGTRIYVKIGSAIDNGDGTITITIALCSDAAYASGGGGATLTGDSVGMVSWMERCRLEQDQVDAAWKGATVTFDQQGRVVQQKS
jgi:hypothetical protein